MYPKCSPARACKSVLFFPFFIFKLDEIRIAIPRRSRFLAWQSGCIGRRWQAKRDPDSDHFFITFDIVIGDAEPLGSQVPKRSYYSWDRADWKEFRRRVTEDCKEFPKKGTPDQQAKFLSRSIAKATAEVVPKGGFTHPHQLVCSLRGCNPQMRKTVEPVRGRNPHPATAASCCNAREEEPPRRTL
ncbi:hypothetical protein XU18_0519 [Perkinsela sp. CCAP 1560/4]|nr:hypothetical protein XU18_0519 [Perkinsela sp. CCAP 1560/4]|eukprot:KNH09241.1 hypothetical protein XU18_0519 [Perkinsela sp. CCAP 1560/4]